MCLSVCLSCCLSVRLSVRRSVRPFGLSRSSVRLSDCLSVYLFVCLSVRLFVSLSVSLSVYLSVYRSFEMCVCMLGFLHINVPPKALVHFLLIKHMQPTIPVFVLTMSLCSACQFMKTLLLPIYIIK